MTKQITLDILFYLDTFRGVKIQLPKKEFLNLPKEEKLELITRLIYDASARNVEKKKIELIKCSKREFKAIKEELLAQDHFSFYDSPMIQKQMLQANHLVLVAIDIIKS